VPKFWEGTQHECTSVAAFFSWSFLPPNSQSPPTINVLLLMHFLVCHFCGKIVRVCPMLPHFLSSHFWAQIVTVRWMWMHWCFCIFQWVISVQCEHIQNVSGWQVTIYLNQVCIHAGPFSLCICTHCFSAWNVQVHEMFKCTRCQ